METLQQSKRHQELLALFEHHLDAERVNDVEACMKTVGDDIVYEHPFRPGEDFLIVGREAVRKYYIRRWAEQPFQKIRVLRSWQVGDNGLLVETESIVGTKDEPPRRLTTFALGIFRDGKLVQEITVGGPPEPLA